MAIWRFESYTPEIGQNTYVAEYATVIGNVKIGERCYIGPGAVIRGDYGRIEIGDETSIQENVVVHARPGEETIIGTKVTAGHSCLLHTCIVDDFSVVGMQAVVSDYALMEEWSILAENSLLRKGQKLHQGEIAIGSPARVIANLKDRPELKQELENYKNKYVEMVKRYQVEGALERID